MKNLIDAVYSWPEWSQINVLDVLFLSGSSLSVGINVLFLLGVVCQWGWCCSIFSFLGVVCQWGWCCSTFSFLGVVCQWGWCCSIFSFLGVVCQWGWCCSIFVFLVVVWYLQITKNHYLELYALYYSSILHTNL